MVVPKENRREKIETELQRRSSSDGPQETLSLNWKGERKIFPVISLELDAVVLNPHSHRIRAQIESHPEGKRLKSEPFSSYAQGEFADMLRATDGFGDLKENLRGEGQEEPGVVTREGLLVNGNRRVTALREINGIEHVRLAVLPEGVSNEEILNVEADLQVRREFRAPYTFTNRLLLVDELLTSYGKSKGEVALQLREATSEADIQQGKNQIDRYQLQLALVREAQQMSKVDGEPQVGLVFFDDKEQSVSELEKEYRQLKKKSSTEEAERLKKTRLVGLFAEYGYQGLRRMDSRFMDDYFIDTAEGLSDALKVDYQRTVQVDGGEESPDEDDGSPSGLDRLGGGTDTSRKVAADPSPLVQALAQSHGEGVAELPTQDGKEKPVSHQRIVNEVRAILDRATEEARLDRKEENLLTKPIRRTSTAASKLNKALKTYREAREYDGFDREEMSKKIREVEDALDELEGAFDSDMDA